MRTPVSQASSYEPFAKAAEEMGHHDTAKRIRAAAVELDCARIRLLDLVRPFRAVVRLIGGPADHGTVE
jgi:rubrerythrin